MDVWEAVEKRKTIRVFKEGVSEELLKKIILAGTKAPSPRNTQPWEFIIVNDPKIIEKIAEQKYKMHINSGSTEEHAMSQRNVLKNSSVVAVCYRKGGLANIAAWMATLNMALVATAEGLGSVMSTMIGEHKDAVEQILCLPEEYELATVMVIGVPVSIPQRREIGVERPDFSWLHIDRFGSTTTP